MNLAAEVGVVRREGAAQFKVSCESIALLQIEDKKIDENILDLEVHHETLKIGLDKSDAYAKSLNERLVLLEIEKTAAPKLPDEPPPSRRSFASQKARAEAGARKT